MANRTRPIAIFLTCLSALPLVLFAMVTLVGELRHIVADDPCYVWGQSRVATLRVGAPPCEHFAAGTSDTKSSAILRLTMIQGSMLVGSTLALVGAFRRRRRLCVIAFAMIALISVPLMLSGLGFMTLGCALCFLPACFAKQPNAA